MPGLFVFLFALHLAAGLLSKRPPKDGERHATMVAFVVIVTTLVAKPWPPSYPCSRCSSPPTCSGRARSSELR